MTDLIDLKPGDRVCVRRGRGKRLATIARLTKTQIVLDDGGRYRRSTGRVIGDHGVYSYALIAPATPGDVRDIRLNQLGSRARAVASDACHLADPREMVNRLRKALTAAEEWLALTEAPDAEIR